MGEEFKSGFRSKRSDGLAEAISRFGVAVKAKLSGKAIAGEPEDQLCSPFESLLSDLVEVLGFQLSEIVAIGETSLGDLNTRPDYAVTRRHALVGFIELKAPGKGADPRRFRDKRDREQWKKLRRLTEPYVHGREYVQFVAKR